MRHRVWLRKLSFEHEADRVVFDHYFQTIERLEERQSALDAKLSELSDGHPLSFPAGGVDLRVFVRRLPARGHASELRFEHTDPSPALGRCHPYWIRVTQEDGAQAWTSPVYLER